LGLLIFLWLIPSKAVSDTLSVDGTQFVLVTNDGKTRKGLDLVGATMSVEIAGERMDITIASGESDVSAVGGPIVLYQFVTKDDEGHQTNICEPDASGKTWGFPFPDERGGFALTCTSGAIGKCIRWGYRLWEERRGGPPLKALHAACVQMVRADYGGDNHPTTTDGKTVYVCDRFGIRACPRKPPLEFEAGWGLSGATCVARTRVSKNITLSQLEKRYPRLKSRTGRACTQERASADPKTLLFNRS
jgi:hypothetical protein